MNFNHRDPESAELPCFSEFVIATSETITVRVEVKAVWEMKLLTMKPLKVMLEHWAINLFEDVLANLDQILGCDTHYVAIESSMVNLAKGESILNSWFSLRFAVFNDVGGIKELLMAKAAERALVLISS